MAGSGRGWTHHAHSQEAEWRKPVFSSPPPFLSVWDPNPQNGTTHMGAGGVFLSLVMKSRKSSTLLLLSLHIQWKPYTTPYMWLSLGDISWLWHLQLLKVPTATQASPLQFHAMTSEGLLPSQGLYEWTPPPHISLCIHLKSWKKIY